MRHAADTYSGLILGVIQLYSFSLISTFVRLAMRIAFRKTERGRFEARKHWWYSADDPGRVAGVIEQLQ